MKKVVNGTMYGGHPTALRQKRALVMEISALKEDVAAREKEINDLIRRGENLTIECAKRATQIDALKQQHADEISAHLKRYDEKRRESDALAIKIINLKRERTILFAALEKTSR